MKKRIIIIFFAWLWGPVLIFLVSASTPNVYADNSGEGEFYDSAGDGAIDRMGRYRNWRDSWACIIPGNFGGSGYTDLLFYDRTKGEGELYTCDGRGNIVPLRTYRNWRTSWHLIVPGNFDENPSQTDLLFYDQNAGVGEFYALDGRGGMTLLRRYRNWRKTWDLIIPGNFKVLRDEFTNGPFTDLLFYDRETGTAEIYATDGSAGLTFLKRYTNWRKSWTQIIPGDFSAGELYFTDLLFYDRMAGEGVFYSTDGAGGLRFLKKYDNWRRTWAEIVPGNFGGSDHSDLLFYDSSIGTGEFYTTDGGGNLTRLRFYNNWRKTWSGIVPGNYGRVGSTDRYTDLLFYDKKIKMIPDWAHVSDSPFDNISDRGISNPVIEPRDITDLPGASYAADPFLFYEEGVWYLFFEAAPMERRHFETKTGAKSAGTRSIHWGRIALATSRNETDWEYQGIVLDEVYPLEDPRGSVHHSYPQVFKTQGHYYMITEAYMQKQIRFYEAAAFPNRWERVYTITKCTSDPAALVTPGQCIDTDNPAIGYIDPSIFRFNNKWWIFGSAINKCYLYFSDDLLGPWEEHPQSPIVSDNPSDIHYYEDAHLRARPGGRAFVFDHDHIIRLVQENPTRDEDGKKIWRVRAFEVTLSETEYSETEIHEGASFCDHKGVFCESGSGWNEYGMHHFDAWWSGDHWLIATDGFLEGAHEISVGIFRSPPPAGVPEEPFMEREREIRTDVR